MNSGFFKVTLMTTTLLITTLALANSTTTTYHASQLWTGDNKWSSSPQPNCLCDADPNSQDCPTEFTVTEAAINSDICYDEFIPADSRGWVHAIEYKKVLK